MNKIATGVIGVLLGALGIHWFLMGNWVRGLVYLLITILLSWTVIAPIVMEILGLVEGIVILTKTDEEFQAVLDAKGQGLYGNKKQANVPTTDKAE